MKEELPKRMLSLHVEVPPEQVEKGLDRAARRFSQQYPIPGFRKGKAPRFIIERYIGRDALLEEASDQLIDQSLKEALKQEKITPIGQVSIQSFELNPFSFRVLLSLPPIVELPNYHDIRIPLEVSPLTPDDVQSFIESLREKHVLLQELEEPRPAAEGDQVTLMVRPVFITENGSEPVPDVEEEERGVALVADHVIPGLYDELIDCRIGDERTIFASIFSSEEDDDDEDMYDDDDEDMYDDNDEDDDKNKSKNENENKNENEDEDDDDEDDDDEDDDREPGYAIRVVNIQQRILPEYEELPSLEGFDGSFEEFQESMHQRLSQFMQDQAKQSVIREFLEQVFTQTTFEIPDAIIQQAAENFLDEYIEESAQQGTSISDDLSEPGPRRQEVLMTLLPEAEQQVRHSLLLQTMIQQEALDVSKEEVEHELLSVLQSNPIDINYLQNSPQLGEHLLRTSVDRVVHRKLHDRIIEIATGEATAAEATADNALPSSDETATHQENDATPANETTTPQESESSTATPTTDVTPSNESSTETDVSSKTG